MSHYKVEITPRYKLPNNKFKLGGCKPSTTKEGVYDVKFLLQIESDYPFEDKGWVWDSIVHKVEYGSDDVFKGFRSSDMKFLNPKDCFKVKGSFAEEDSFVTITATRDGLEFIYTIDINDLIETEGINSELNELSEAYSIDTDEDGEEVVDEEEEVEVIKLNWFERTALKIENHLVINMYKYLIGSFLTGLVLGIIL